MVTVCLLNALTASAQDQPKIGLTMGYPSAIGVLWHVADRVALRPEATAIKNSSESSSTDSLVGTRSGSTPSDNWQLGVGVSALFYVSRSDALSTYVTPRLAYAKSSTSASVAGTSVSSTFDSRSYTTGGSFGGQYVLGRHFGLFGELGVSYTSATTEASTIETITTATFKTENRTHTVGTRSGVGVILFF